MSGLVLMTGLSGLAQNLPTTVEPEATPASGSTSAAVTRSDTARHGVSQIEQRQETAERAARSVPQPKAPARQQLMPLAPQGEQTAFRPSSEEMRNARTIIRTARKADLPPRAAVIAVATSLQESHLRNYGHLGAANDHDSLGLFQQRPSTNWGSPEQIQNPEYSAGAFYGALKQVDGWQTRPLTDVAQEVQVSAYPDAYAKWETMAVNLVRAEYGQGPYAGIDKQGKEKAAKVEAAEKKAAKEKAAKAEAKAREAQERAREAKEKAEQEVRDKARQKAWDLDRIFD